MTDAHWEELKWAEIQVGRAEMLVAEQKARMQKMTVDRPESIKLLDNLESARASHEHFRDLIKGELAGKTWTEADA